MSAEVKPFNSEELSCERILLGHECAVRQCSDLNAVRDEIDRRYLATIDALVANAAQLVEFVRDIEPYLHHKSDSVCTLTGDESCGLESILARRAKLAKGSRA